MPSLLETLKYAFVQSDSVGKSIVVLLAVFSAWAWMIIFCKASDILRMRAAVIVITGMLVTSFIGTERTVMGMLECRCIGRTVIRGGGIAVNVGRCGLRARDHRDARRRPRCQQQQKGQACQTPSFRFVRTLVPGFAR